MLTLPSAHCLTALWQRFYAAADVKQQLETRNFAFLEKLGAAPAKLASQLAQAAAKVTRKTGNS